MSVNVTGIIKIRGQYKDIKNFLRKTIFKKEFKYDPKTNMPFKYLPVKIEEDSNLFCISSRKRKNARPYQVFNIESTSALINDPLKICFDWSLKEDDVTIIALDVEFINDASIESFKGLSKYFNIDIKIITTDDCYGNVEEEFEIIDGELISEKSTTYEDYDWESPYKKRDNI